MKRNRDHDERAVAAGKQRREQSHRDEQRSEWDRFEDLTRRLVRTPKRETDEKRSSG